MRSDASEESSRADRLSRILVVRLGAMGDILHAMPAVAAIREVNPQCSVDWVVEERWTELLSAPNAEFSGPISVAKPLVDRILTVNTRAWRKSLLSVATWSHVRNSIGNIRSEPYDCVIDFQGAIKSSIVGSFARKKKFVGFSKPRESVAALLYSQKCTTSSKHVIKQNLELASLAASRRLGFTQPQLPTHAESEQWAATLQAQLGAPFAILNPGAGWGAKQWPLEQFGEVARALQERGIRSLINFGPGEETIANSLQRLSEGAATPVRCNVSQMIALTRRASLVIGGDTGPIHLAAALGVPVVALFGPTDPERNGPYGTRSVVLRDAASATSYKHVSDADAGLANIAPQQVVEAAEKLLG